MPDNRWQVWQNGCNPLDCAEAAKRFVECQTQTAPSRRRPSADVPKLAKILQGADAFVIIVLEPADRPANQWMQFRLPIEKPKEDAAIEQVLHLIVVDVDVFTGIGRQHGRETSSIRCEKLVECRIEVSRCDLRVMMWTRSGHHLRQF
jgi:hypothetical protein